jgi:hypothetical protein
MSTTPRNASTTDTGAPRAASPTAPGRMGL